MISGSGSGEWSTRKSVCEKEVRCCGWEGEAQTWKTVYEKRKKKNPFYIA